MIEDTNKGETSGVRHNAGRRNAAYETATHDSAVAFSIARAKEKEHQAKLAEMKAKQVRGELLDAAEVTKQADRAARFVRDAFLALPDRMASVLLGKTEQEIMLALRREIQITLRDVAARIEDVRPDP